LLADGSFDELSGVWVEDAPDDSIIVTDTAAHSGGYSAELGPDMVGGTLAFNDLYQSVTIPANATEVTVDGYYQIYDAVSGDQITLALLDDSLSELAVFNRFVADSDVFDWTYFSFTIDVTNLQDTTITFDLIGTVESFFYFDTLSLKVTACEAP
jgi:hypothetical protein